MEFEGVDWVNFMKAEDLRELIKKGQKSFKDINLGGCFINDDLRNLIFENCLIDADFSGANLSRTIFKNCNLKSCIFCYSNLDLSKFEGNFLDDTEFNFAQFRYITFINNSAYGSIFSKEILEMLRYPDFPGFHIMSVNVGWFEIILAGRDKMLEIPASIYLGNDAPWELLKALNSLYIQNSQKEVVEAIVCWDGEPNATIWKIKCEFDKIFLSIYTSDCESYEIDRTSLDTYTTGVPDFEVIGMRDDFINEIIKSFENIVKRMGKEDYMKEWSEFPDYQLAELKARILNRI
ncbi:MAG: pentapeptide repeat-containing protein [Bacillota bacterium]|nr:pentapeptide repeat-containing protein [Bacillota bacterium]